jgi:hypothetical protein
MAKVSGLLVLLCLSLLASAQQHNKELLQGTWIVSGVRSIPSFVGYRSNYNSIDSFKTVKILNDSFMKLEFNRDTLTIIKHQTYNNDTQDYLYELHNDGYWLKTWPVDKKKKNKHKKRVRLNYISNESMMISESFFNAATSLSTSIRTELYFNKEVPLHVEKERNRLAGTWHVTRHYNLQSHIWGMDSIILQREPSYFSKTSKISSYGDTLSTSKKYHIINFDTENFSILDSISTETIKRDVPERPKGTPRFESYIYGKPNSQFLKFSIVFHNSLVEFIPLNSDLTTKFYSYTFENDKLVLTKQQN